MNCKPDDIAYVVGGDAPENVNKLVRVRAPDPFQFHGEFEWDCEALQTMVGFTFKGKSIIAPGHQISCLDRHLRPLHSGDGVDEMVLKAGLPPPVYLPAPSWSTTQSMPVKRCLAAGWLS